MQVFTTKALANDFCLKQKQSGALAGFVPTMGALHTGHLELVKRARAENDIVTCSIFVNPKQFNNPEDLKKYPRTVDEDLEKLKQEGCDMVFVPSVEEMYPDEPEEKYDFGRLERVMEGKFRPGHFRGVAIVVKRLFDIMVPDRAYFGEKDFQQLLIIKKLVEKEKLPVEIVPCPIVREPDGLAMSSRNMRLSSEARKQAPYIFQTLHDAAAKIPATPPIELTRFVEERFRENEYFELEYFEIVTMDDLSTVEKWSVSPDIIACIAVYLEGIRLIDNMILFNNFAVA
jgi:pantoate--beta-alanine ligase